MTKKNWAPIKLIRNGSTLFFLKYIRKINFSAPALQWMFYKRKLQKLWSTECFGEVMSFVFNRSFVHEGFGKASTVKWSALDLDNTKLRWNNNHIRFKKSTLFFCFSNCMNVRPQTLRFLTMLKRRQVSPEWPMHSSWKGFYSGGQLWAHLRLENQRINVAIFPSVQYNPRCNSMSLIDIKHWQPYSAFKSRFRKLTEKWIFHISTMRNAFLNDFAFLIYA